MSEKDMIHEIIEEAEETEEELVRRYEEKEKLWKQQRMERGFSDSDVWNLYDWFISTVKPMLQQLRDTHVGSPGYLGKNYTDERGILVNDTCHEEWDAILDRMIFLLGEMDEDTCSLKNPYSDAVTKAYDEFEEKYGLFGEKLETEEEKKKAEETGNHRMYFPDDEPNRPDVVELFKNYRAEERKLDEYRLKCKDEFFKLFSKHFYALWD